MRWSSRNRCTFVVLLPSIIVGLTLLAIFMNFQSLGQVMQNNNNIMMGSEEVFSTESLFVKEEIPKSRHYTHETNVFQQMFQRSSSIMDTCQSLNATKKEVNDEKSYDTGVSPLPENGFNAVLKQWLQGNKTEEIQEGGKYPVCHLPPPKSCNVTSYSAILMSHTVSDAKRLGTMMGGIEDLAKRQQTAEIILVWNSERSILTSSQNGKVKQLLSWESDASHPLRIFYSLEEGLGNNLLNRYHPSLNPTQDVVMYFDDDGPFFSEKAMGVGFKLWQRNSDTQIGCFGRNIRFPSKRMQDIQMETTQYAVKMVEQNDWSTHISPYDSATISKRVDSNKNIDQNSLFPKFTPICNNETNDKVEYNFFVFPNFEAHMFLPSGTFLHKSFLCFIWHPVFKELRDFILDHPTHPDDMMVSTLVSHLSGKGLRSFPRRIVKDDDSSNNIDEKAQTRKNEKQTVRRKLLGKHHRQRRRLLWQQKDWGNMREEAINSIVNYFGSINPGSLGWCVGSQYNILGSRGKKKGHYECAPEFAQIGQIPWMNKGGLGHDQCLST